METTKESCHSILYHQLDDYAVLRRSAKVYPSHELSYFTPSLPAIITVKLKVEIVYRPTILFPNDAEKRTLWLLHVNGKIITLSVN